MTIHSAKLIHSGVRGDDVILSSGQTINNFHKGTNCFGDVCPVHSPSDHTMREWPLAFNGRHMVRIMPGVTVTELHGTVVAGTHSDKPVLVVIDPDDFIYNVEGTAIIRNSGICKKCGDHFFSSYRHDYASCKCGKSFTDGGFDYIRQSADVENTSIVYTKLAEA